MKWKRFRRHCIWDLIDIWIFYFTSSALHRGWWHTLNTDWTMFVPECNVACTPCPVQCILCSQPIGLSIARHNGQTCPLSQTQCTWQFTICPRLEVIVLGSRIAGSWRVSWLYQLPDEGKVSPQVENLSTTDGHCKFFTQMQNFLYEIIPLTT